MKKKAIKPLLIACSGGYGHIAAALGIIENLAQDYTLNLTEHSAQRSHYFATQKPCFYARLLRLGIQIFSIPYLGYCLKKLPIPWGIAHLPHRNEFYLEINRLLHHEKTHGIKRLYLDLLLD